MTKLMHIEASPRKKRSKSISIAKIFIEAYREANMDDEVETLDLWTKELPEFNNETIDAKYRVLHGQEHSSEQASAWQTIVDLCEHFKSADKYLISLPMWNFGIPYKLKHYIDIIAQPGQTFSFSPETGYTGLVTGKPVAVVYARGGAYSAEKSQTMDFQKSYMELLLGFIGFTDIRPIIFEPTLASPDDVAQSEAAAILTAKQIAASI